MYILWRIISATCLFVFTLSMMVTSAMADPTVITAISIISSLAGTAVSAAGTLAAGKQEQANANYQAQQLEIRANEEMAAGQREGFELERRKKLALSSLQNKAAGGGFSATDKTALDLTGDIEEYGTLQQQMATYGGASRKRGNEALATGARVAGNAAVIGSRYTAAGTIAGGISTMFDKYAPKASAANNYNYIYASG